jgi:hypothetical protein
MTIVEHLRQPVDVNVQDPVVLRSAIQQERCTLGTLQTGRTVHSNTRDQSLPFIACYGEGGWIEEVNHEVTK